MGLLYDALPDWMQEELTGLLEAAPEKGNLYGWLSDQMPNPPGSYRGAIVPAITYDGKSSEWAVPGMVRDTALGWAELLDAAASPEKAMKAYNEGLSGDAIMSIPMMAAPQVAAGAMGKVPKGALGIFGGPGAKTADKAALKLAKEMAENGADRRQIWDATGWFKGVDDKWRFEIDDSKSMFRGVGEGPGFRAGQAIHHPDLYEAYPSLEDARVRPMPGRGGSYEDVGVGTVYLGADEGASTHNTALHELQHALQGREGFAAGGTPDRGWKRGEMFDAAKRSYEDAKFGAHSGMSDDELLAELTGRPIPQTAAKPWAELTDRQRLEWLENGRDRLYRSLAGETEARNVERRANMTMGERRATPPWETADVPEADQIIRFDAGQMNFEPPMTEKLRKALLAPGVI